VNCDKRPRDFEIDIDSPCHLEGVLDLVAMRDELGEAPRSDFELFPGQILELVQRIGYGKAIIASEVFGSSHSPLFGR
jgi:hypothetical protein